MLWLYKHGGNRRTDRLTAMHSAASYGGCIIIIGMLFYNYKMQRKRDYFSSKWRVIEVFLLFLLL